MAALQDIKRRINSVRSTRQITKAMQLVAASKLRTYAAEATGPKPYVEAIEALLERLSQPSATNHPFFDDRPPKRCLTIFVGGDRTLAGPYNANLARAFTRLVGESTAEHEAIAIGRQAAIQLARLGDVEELAAYDLESGRGDVELAQPIMTQAAQRFIDGQVDRVDLLQTVYHSSIQQTVTVTPLLPIKLPATPAAVVTLEPDAETAFDLVARRWLESRLLAAILDARASEQAARMVAMMTASDNASQLIDDYTLTYNNARQAAITQELAEISAGAEATTI